MMKIIMENANMMEETVVITMQMDGTHTVKNANVKIPMLQIVLISGQIKDAQRRKTKETVEKQLLLGIARQHVNFVDVSIFGQKNDVNKTKENVEWT